MSSPEADAAPERSAPRHPHLIAAGLMAGASLLFALMGVLVKLASTKVPAGEIVLWRSGVGALFILGWVAWRGGTLATSVPSMHFWRSTSGVVGLALWFYSIGGLPLATAMTLNYMSSVWMALFLIGGAVLLGASRIDGRLVAAVMAGFVGVALVLQPAAGPDSWWHGLAGLLSGVLAAMAYLQVTALGRAGEPEYRVVFYFSLGGVVVGGTMVAWTGAGSHGGWVVPQLLSIGALATLGQVMMTRAYGIGHPLANGALQYLGIVFSFVFGVLIFDEAITPFALAGVTLIVAAGLAATVLRQRLGGPARDVKATSAGDL